MTSPGFLLPVQEVMVLSQVSRFKAGNPCRLRGRPNFVADLNEGREAQRHEDNLPRHKPTEREERYTEFLREVRRTVRPFTNYFIPNNVGTCIFFWCNRTFLIYHWKSKYLSFGFHPQTTG